MTTNTLPAGLAGLTIDHARRLERESRRGKRQVEAFQMTGGKFKRRVLVAFAKSLLTGKPAEFIDRLTLTVTDQTVWFQGLRASIEGGTMKMDEDNDALHKAVTGAQASIADLRVTLLGLQETLSQVRDVSSPVMQSLGRLLTGLTDVFNAMEGVRWSVLEREADDDIAAGRVSKRFTSANDLIASLNS